MFSVEPLQTDDLGFRIKNVVRRVVKVLEAQYPDQRFLVGREYFYMTHYYGVTGWTPVGGVYVYRIIPRKIFFVFPRTPLYLRVFWVSNNAVRARYNPSYKKTLKGLLQELRHVPFQNKGDLELFVG